MRRDRITRIAALPGELLRHEMTLPHGDPSGAFIAGILDEVALPLVTAAPGQQEPPRPRR